MQNAAGASDVPLTVFGGAVTEMNPEDLPEGASPYNQDMDFTPGSASSRGGRKSQYSFGGLFSLDSPASALNLAGSSSAAWAAPLNITLNTPGTYANVSLNTPGFSAGGFWDNLGSKTQSGTTNVLAFSATPTIGGEVALYMIGTSQGGTTSPKPNPTQGWTDITSQIAATATSYQFYGWQIAGGQVTSNVTFGSGNSSAYGAICAFFGSATGGLPTIRQSTNPRHAGFGAGTIGPLSITGVQQNSSMIVMLQTGNSAGGQTLISGVSATDNQGNTYSLIGSAGQANGGNGTAQNVMLFTPRVNAGTLQITITIAAGNLLTGDVIFIEVGGLSTIGSSALQSQTLEALNYAFAIPTNALVTGMQVELAGHQTTLNPDMLLSVQLANASATKTINVQLPLADGVVVAGSPTETWGMGNLMTPAVLNDPNFAVKITAQTGATPNAGFFLYGAKIRAFYTPSPPQNFDWVKTFQQDDGSLRTLALDAGGIMWQEDAVNNPGVLNSIFSAIAPNTFAKSVTFGDVEFIALSNLLNGTDVPRMWDGKNFDRVSQYGPGAPPSFASSGAGINITSITQPTAKSDVEAPGHLSGLLWSAGPGSTSPGNVLTVYYSRTAALASPDPDIQVGRSVALAGLGGTNSIPQLQNGVYTIVSTGQGVPPGAQYSRWYFTLQMTQSLANNQANHQEGNGPLGTYQVTEATLTAATQVPNLDVGGQMTLAGTGGAPTAGYDGTWTVDQSPNAAVLQVVSVTRVAGTASYSYVAVSGTPQVGQAVTIVGTLADGGSFNVSNATINSVSPGSFSLLLPGNDVSPSAENGSATINGTIFLFNPQAIIGTKNAGSIITAGVIGAGIRRAVCIFQKRSGGITAASNYVEFTITGSASILNASQIPIGPPDTTRRIIAFTGAGGGNYFYIPQPVTVTVNGQKVVYSSTVIPDNISTTATFTFPDALLLASTAIDVQGNNLFSQHELGSCLGFVSYSSRVFAWGEQNKVQNLLNLSFDGGIGGSSPSTYPLGWTVDPVNGGGGSVSVSPIFGNSYLISNATGITQALYGMITQGAYVNQLGTPIITPNTLYSVRLAVRQGGGPLTGNAVVDLFSPQLNQVFGSFTVPLSSLTTNMQILTGTLLANPFGIVPKDLILRVYASAIPNGASVEFDRVEPFPTAEPVVQTSFTSSYVNNPQGFDLVTGYTGPNQNQQPIKGAATMFDLLYALKSGSIFSTSDNGQTEPNLWNWREVSNTVGTIGIHSYAYGEEWLITACRPGVYFFNGGAPIKISQEIQTLWDMINWNFGHTIWVRNDITAKRILIGVPIATGPTQPSFQYLPEFPINASPTSPNVVITINYRELNTGMALAEVGPIKSSYSGRLLSPEPARKTSFWNIRAPYADFVKRSDNTEPLFLCSGYSDSKIFALDPNTLHDDGTPINAFYITYGFTKAEMADAKGLGLHRMLAQYMTTLGYGIGNLNILIYPDSPQNPLPIALDPIALSPFTQGDLESGIDYTANRFFVRYGQNSVGSKFAVSKVVMSLKPDPWSPIRGSATGGI